MNDSNVENGVVQDLVVIGASAGGVEALSLFVSTLRRDFPAPIVIAQHLDPHRPSLLAATLERRSTLPVVLVSDVVALRPGTIYVVPSNSHVTIDVGTVQLEGDHQERPRPSVDLLFKTAAKAYGDRLVAVILTGSGSDGAAGAIEVKRSGGVVIIQNPDTARYPSMPLALPPTAVDHIADLERMGLLIYDIVTGMQLSDAPEEQKDVLAEIIRTVSMQADIDFRQYKPATILRRIGRRMAITHTGTLQDYASLLQVDSKEAAELTMAFLIKVTEFFRDEEAFTFLRREVIPELVALGRQNSRVLRLWSAGCATGEEPYSLALLLADHLGHELPEWSIKIFATDIDERAIEFARRGLYAESALENLADGLRERFFEKIDGGFSLTKAARQLVIFGHQDLGRAVPFPRIDLIVCRNLLIYFKPALQQQVLDSFAYSLSKNGFLFLGKAETARPSKAVFELADKRWKIYRCVNCPIGMRSYHSVERVGVSSDRRTIGSSLEDPERPLADRGMQSETELAHLRHFNDLVLRLLPVGVVVVDRTYRIVTISGAARRKLGVREVGVDQDFLHSIRGLPYARVRSAIDSVFRDKTALTLSEFELDPATGGDGRYVLLSIALMSLDPSIPELAVISVTDATDQIQTRKRLESVQAEQTLVVDELSTFNKRLSDLNKELQDVNEELQAANEELMLTQEELQASNEEFEATNEELQATNEELETNNEELQATNEELEATNDELTARSQELYQIMRAHEIEQERLGRIVDLAPMGVVVLHGMQLDVEFHNARSAGLFEPADAKHRAFDEVFAGDEKQSVIDACREAFRSDEPRHTKPFRVSSRETDAPATLARLEIVPMHDEHGAVDGLVLYLLPAGEDVSEFVDRTDEAGSAVGS
jgi:two-component system, chemotaxis family, CheB/CheR fusion protein